MMAKHAKKHHFVPQFLLQSFASPSRQLTVHRLLGDRPYVAAIGDIGQRKFGHTIYRPGREPDHESLEQGMSSIESETALVIGELRNSAVQKPSPAQQEILAWFIALQWQRHRTLLDLVRRQFTHDVEPEPGTPEHDYLIKSAGLLAIAMNVTTPWANRQYPMSRPKERWNSIVERLTSGLAWKLLRPKTPKLIVSDNIVCLSGVAAGYSSPLPPVYAKHGLGIGFENFQRLTVPLTPSLGLVISRSQDDAMKINSDHFNRYTVFSSREFVAHNPRWPRHEHRQYKALKENLELQRWLVQSILPGLRLTG